MYPHRSSASVDTVAPSPAPSPSDDQIPEARDPWWKRPKFWLAVMVVGFFVISLYSGVVSYADLQTQNSTDAGIITQAVSSTASGHNAPFYESYDCIVKSRCSFLLVHPGFVLYLAVPFYDLAASTLTLFALRAALVAGAAVPLYWLTRQVTRSPGKGLLAAGLFLVWAPSYVGDAFSTHLESLLPIELFTIAALWVAGRYRLALLVAVVTFLTFEVYPLFTFLLGAFFLYPYLERPVRARWREWRTKTEDHRSLRAWISAGWADVREALRVREVRYILVLMAASVAAYVALSLFINVWGYQVLGVAAPPVGPGITGIFSNPSSPSPQSLGTILTSAQTLRTAEYWVILYGLVAFIPLLSPRALIISLPWIGWTFLTDSNRFSTLGHQYSLVAAGPLFIGLAYGLQRVRVARPSGTPNSTTVTAGASPGGAAGPARSSWREQLPSGRFWVGALTFVVVANIFLAPINPAVPALGLVPGAPFQPNYFDHSLEISPSFPWVEKLVSVIPTDATVLAASAVFPLLVNDPHAYVLTPPDRSNFTNLPFNDKTGPEYALLGTAGLDTLGPDLTRNLSNPALYGLRAYVGDTTVGELLLYQKGYVSSAEVFGPAVPALAGTYVPGAGLVAGPRGIEATNISAPSRRVIESIKGPNRTGLIWTGPYQFLVPGNYTVRVQVAATGIDRTTDPTARVLLISVDGFSGTPVNDTLDASDFVSGEWITVTLNFTLIDPLPNVNVDGFAQGDQFSLAVDSISIAPDTM
jgi:uncharacterized membrane protein